MNSLHATKRKQRNTHGVRAKGRSGLSIIEVLTSIVVAMIGVFGVMILIPFAVKQAQIGLDSDAAVMLGRNAYAQFEIAAYRNPENWGLYRGPNAPSVTPYSPYAITDQNNDGDTLDAGDIADLPEVFSIDPLGINENGGATFAAQYTNASFPYAGFNAGTTNTYPLNLTFRAVTLRTPIPTIPSFMSIESARRLFRSSDDLVFGEAVDDFFGPEQVFDQVANPMSSQPDFLRRQSRGYLSWSAIVVPYKPDATSTGTLRWSYKMYILVYKDRPTLTTGDPEDGMATALVTNSGFESPTTNLNLANDVASVPINRDEWVMLVNRDASATAEDGFRHRIAFYRVISVADRTATTAATITVDGPDFNFANPTYVVHLNSVVGVFERTFETEDASTWTN